MLHIKMINGCILPFKIGRGGTKNYACPGSSLLDIETFRPRSICIQNTKNFLNSSHLFLLTFSYGSSQKEKEEFPKIAYLQKLLF